VRPYNFGASGIYPHETFPDDVPRGRARRGDNLGTIFGRIAPKVLGGPKNIQISARFLTTFDFDREYLRNGSTYRTSIKKTWLATTFHVGRNKFDELWSTNEKVLGTHIDPPKWTLFGRLHFGPYHSIQCWISCLCAVWQSGAVCLRRRLHYTRRHSVRPSLRLQLIRLVLLPLTAFTSN